MISTLGENLSSLGKLVEITMARISGLRKNEAFAKKSSPDSKLYLPLKIICLGFLVSSVALGFNVLTPASLKPV
jgi:hypothetical protein